MTDSQRVAIKREGPWRLTSTTVRGTETIMDLYTLEPFMMLWRLVKEEMDMESAFAAVIGDSITIRLLPKLNRIEVILEDRTDVYECQPINTP